MPEKNILHEEIMSDQTKGEPLSLETYTAVLKHINKAGQYFKDAMYIYMSNFRTRTTIPNFSDYGKVKIAN